MQSAHRALPPAAAALAVLLSLSWGFNQVAIKLALPEIPPLIQAAFRSTGAAVIVVVWAWLRGASLLQTKGALIPGMIAGALFALEFILIFHGLLYSPATRASVFIYTAPFFVVLAARWFLPAERFDRAQWFGLVLSFTGIIVAFGVPTPGGDPREFVGDIMLLGAGAAWGATTVVIKATTLAKAPSDEILLYQLLVSAPVLILSALLTGERMHGLPSAVPLGSLVYQTAWVVAMTYMAWFALIARYSASRLSVFTFLTPLFGVAAGHFVLGEPLTAGFAIAAGFVVLGLILVNRAR